MTTTLARIDEKLIHKTPRGLCLWPKLLVPNTKFDPAFGTYEILLTFDPPVERDFRRQMTAIYDDAYEQKRREKAQTELAREQPPWKRAKKDGTGPWEFKFKLKAGGITAEGRTWKSKPPKLFDAKANRIEPDPETFLLGNGSLCRVFFQVKPYFVQKCGITLKLCGVQIFKYEEYDDAAFFGVEAEDGDFVYQQPQRKAVAAPELPPDDGEDHVPVVTSEDDTPAAETPITDDDIPF